MVVGFGATCKGWIWPTQRSVSRLDTATGAAMAPVQPDRGLSSHAVDRWWAVRTTVDSPSTGPGTPAAGGAELRRTGLAGDTGRLPGRSPLLLRPSRLLDHDVPSGDRVLRGR